MEEFFEIMNKAKLIKEEFKKADYDKDWSFANKKYKKYSHNYHRYPAKFIPPIAKKIILEGSNEDEVICDLFGGCGTSLVQAKLLGRKSFGIDVNPVAKFITDVKVNAIEPNKLEIQYKKIEQRIRRKNKKFGNSDFIKHPRLSYWFTDETFEKLFFIYNAILTCDDIKVRNFILCAFSHCLKNCSRWLMKSIKPTIDKQKKNIDIEKTFFRHLNLMIKQNKTYYGYLAGKNLLNIESKIYRQDCTKPINELIDSVDLIISSPPYVTSYEYGDLHQLTLLWFGSDKKNFKEWGEYIEDFAAFKSSFIGSQNSREESLAIGSGIGESIVRKLKKLDNPLAKKVKVYFEKMNKAFNEMYQLLKEGKEANIIIGNTKLKGVEILNAEVCLEQMINVGFTKKKVIKRNCMTNKMIPPYRDKITGKFTSKNNRNKKIAYNEEFIIKVRK